MKNVTLGPSNIFDFPNICPFSPGGFWTFLVALAHGGAAAPWRPKNLGQGCQAGQGWAGLGRAGLGQLGRARGLSPGIRRKQILPPAQCAPSADWKFRAWKISSKLSASNCKCINIFFFLLFFLFYYIEILALILMNLRDFPTFVKCKIPWNQRKCQHFFLFCNSCKWL